MAETTSTTASKKIVILGGSYGGVSTAHYVLKHAIPVLPEKESYEVVMVSASAEAFCRPACPRAMISDDFFAQDKLFVSIPKQFEQYPKGSFRFIKGSATQLEHTSQVVTIDVAAGGSEKLEYYALVIATGARTSSPLLGLVRDEAYLRSTWKTFREALPNAKTIVVAGGGPSGIEVAGELGEHLNGRAGWFSSSLANPKVKITVVTSAPKILPNLRPAIADTAEKLLLKVGVNVLKNSRVTTVQPERAGLAEALTTKTTVTLENGQTLDADLYIPALGTNPNTSFISPDLLTSDKRIDTNPTTLRVDKAGPRVYAVGDVASYARAAVHLTLNAIPVVGGNIKRDLLLETSGVKEKSTATAIPEEKSYKNDTSETQMVPIGKSKGVGAAMGYKMPSIFVWLIKGRDYWLWTTGNLWSGKQWAKEK